MFVVGQILLQLNQHYVDDVPFQTVVVFDRSHAVVAFSCVVNDLLNLCNAVHDNFLSLGTAWHEFEGVPKFFCM